MSLILLSRRRGGASGSPPPTEPGLIYQTDFESFPTGKFSGTGWTNTEPAGVPNGTFYWLENHGGTVQNSSPLSGTKSLDMTYGATAVNVSSNPEQRFILNQACTGGFGMEWHQRIGANWTLRDGSSGTTHKWFQVWRSTYTTSFTLGASFRRNSLLDLPNAEFMPVISNTAQGNVVGTNGTEVYGTETSNLLKPAGHGGPRSLLIPGQTQLIRFWVRYSSAPGVADGRYEIWIDGELFLSANCEVWGATAGETPSIVKGYLMGFSNSGYTDATTWTWDNLKFYSGATRWF